MSKDANQGFLGRVRVLELADELGEYCGKLLAGLGADVVKVEPVGGEATRNYGPFYHDIPHPDRSLYFWHYNLGKRSVCLDLDDVNDQASFRQLVESADVVIDARPTSYLEERGLGYDSLRVANPKLIYLRITPFGEDGPWSGYVGSDLVHLALGGVMMNCGYDPEPSGVYDTPPIAPQMWQAYHITGQMGVIGILGALSYRLTSGVGQRLSVNVHEAVSANTETDLPDWIYLRQPHYRLTCRHSMSSATAPALSATKDGRYLLPYRTYVKTGMNTWDPTVRLLTTYEMQGRLAEQLFDGDHRFSPEGIDQLTLQTDRLVSRLKFKNDLWRQAQALGLPWAPVRRPDENLSDAHWHERQAFSDVEHDELGETYTYAGGTWLCEQVDWIRGPRAPLAGEHNKEVVSEWDSAPTLPAQQRVSSRIDDDPLLNPLGKPFALSNVRVIDLSWMLASAGAGRFLTAMGADVIKVEHSSRWDGIRFGLGRVPLGGRDERDQASGPLTAPPADGPNRGGAFMEINAGKSGISLNLKDTQGRTLLEDLIRDADMVIEGFSPGTMERMGLGYERLKELNPNIIYVQQSGFGERGRYGRARAYGPTAQAFTGISDMSGLPAPYPPAGIGYSYLDWFGAYNMATAMLAALYRRNVTGEGCHIDASQCEVGMYLTGTAFLDWSVNGRAWSRYGNQSPYKLAAPHGAYRTAGDDRWIAIGAFTQAEWLALLEVLNRRDWAQDPRFVTLERRLANYDILDELMNQATSELDGYKLMQGLQASSVPAGVCQSAQDRYEADPQLRHLAWLVELDQTEIGRWPIKDVPIRMSETPPYIGGRLDRSGPNYGEDTDRVLSTVLNLTADRIEQLHQEGAL